MSVDIVNLIESNPITKLNGNYQSKLITKVQNNFNNSEQQMFIASFYCYLKHDYKNDFVIDLDNVWQWLGFSQKVRAKELVEKNFNINKDYKLLFSLPGDQKNFAFVTTKAKEETRGGHNKEIFMLNIETFKKFCLKAGTKKADEIHDYFIKLEQILQEILQEESNELKQQLLQVEDQKAKEYELKLEHQKILEREKILLKEYATIGSIVYIIKVKTFENKQYIIKLGESRRGIKERYNEHKSKYEECLLLDCFAVNKSKDFESFLHNHETIRCNRVADLKGHETELELFLIGKNLSYKTILDIINNNIKYFNTNDTSKIELENEQLRLMLEMKNTSNDNLLIQELVKMVKQLSSKIDNLEKTNNEILHKLNKETKITTGFSEPLVTLGPRLQKINPDTLELIKVYESVSEAMKEDYNIKRPSINKAVIENTVYNGFRWQLVDRELDANIINNIKPTKQTKIQSLGYIAKLSNDKNEILNVYLDRKTAAHFNGYISSSALDNHVKNYTMTGGCYYKLFDECDDILKQNFIQNYSEPLLYKNGIGQYDINNNLIREFICKYDCIKQLKMSDKTLSKALTKNTPYNGSYFKDIGTKLKMI
jgi:phage anti-repressor protein